jgi:hypothetical protein
MHKSTINNVIPDSYYLFRGIAGSGLDETTKRDLSCPTLNYYIIAFVDRIAKVL